MVTMTLDQRYALKTAMLILENAFPNVDVDLGEVTISLSVEDPHPFERRPRPELRLVHSAA
jgi:hypothetical protein